MNDPSELFQLSVDHYENKIEIIDLVPFDVTDLFVK